jgi:NADH dehydrogenase (ubiquinone) 1 alpha subcomplex subunit 2
MEQRDFIAQHYMTVKKSNPQLPILIRESAGVEARMFAKFGTVALLKTAT